MTLTQDTSLTTPSKGALARTDDVDTYSPQHVESRAQIMTQLSNVKPLDFTPFGIPNTLNRYHIDINHEIPQFSRKYVKAYKAINSDMPNAQYIAYICDHARTHRHHVLKHYTSINHASLITYVDSGVCYIEAQQQNRFVIIYEKPVGITLRSFMEKNGVYSPNDCLSHIIAPIVEGLDALHRHDVHHGAISPDNIFISGTNVVLGDCIAEPSGTMQPMCYEPVEHLQVTSSIHRGDGNLPDDTYCLGILTLDLLGLRYIPDNVSQEKLVRSLLRRGPYITYISDDTMISNITDLIRGTLHENPSERWSIEQLKEFVGGKRYNIVQPSIPRDNSRPYEFNGNDYHTMRMLAHGLYTHWEKAFDTINDPKLVKWLEAMSNNEIVTENITLLQQRMKGMTAYSKDVNEYITRGIIMLDPHGPIRYKTIALHPSAIPRELLHIMQTGDKKQLSVVHKFLSTGLIRSWKDLAPKRCSAILWNYNNVHKVLPRNSYGFGMERILYEMNPELACLSKDYIRYHANDPLTLIKLLNHDAKEHAQKGKTFMDRHVIAFLAARVQLNKKIVLSEFAPYEKLHQNAELVCMATIGYAQEKVRVRTLPALACWTALRLIDMVESFHSNDTRSNFNKGILSVLPRGHISQLLRVIRNSTVIEKDHKGHLMAMQRYAKYQRKIKRLSDAKRIMQRGNDVGYRVASLVASSILGMVTYHTITQYLN